MPHDHPFLVEARKQEAFEDTFTMIVGGLVLFALHVCGVL